jgi:hyperosmotically inducible protein
MRGYTGGLYAGPPSAQRGYERRGRFAGRGAKGYRRPDERLAAEVCEADPALDANDMTVAVKDGRGTVAGSGA